LLVITDQTKTMIKYILPLFLTCLMLLSVGTANDLFAQKRSKEPAPLTEQQINKRKETFMNAAKARVLEDWSKAEELFNEVLNIDPKHDASMYELAKLYRRQERLDDAILLMEKAISISDGNEWYYLLLGDLYKLTFQLEKLIQTQEKLIAAFPGKIDYRLDLAVSYIITEDFKRAIAVYDDIESTIGKTEDVSLQKQKLYLDLNQPRKALNEIESLVEAYPGNVRYLQILAETYLDAGQDKKALETYQQIAELDPDNAFIHISLADLYRRQGNEQKSFEELKRGFAKPELELDVKIQVLLSFYSFEEFYDTKKEPVLELATILAETHPNESRALSLYGEMLYRNRQLEQALEVINRVLEIDLSRYSVWEQKLLIENEILNSDSLLKTSIRAMELFPMQPLPYLFKGFAHYQLKDWNAAKSALKSGASLVVDNDFLEAQFYSTLGDVHNKLKEHKKSDEYYEKALTLNPEDAYVLNNYGYYLSQRGENLERAKEMAEKANQLMPDTPSFQDTYGWILYKTGDYTEAEKWIRMAIDNDEEGSAVLFEHYGDVLYKLGKKEDALYYWKKASEKNGDTSELLNEKIRTGTLHE
jgi:tetratricopeptide (TPR) repeat protein